MVAEQEYEEDVWDRRLLGPWKEQGRWLGGATMTGIHTCAISPDGKLVAAGFMSKDVQIRELGRDTVVYTLTTGRDSLIRGLAWSPRSGALAVSTHDRTVIFVSRSDSTGAWEHRVVYRHTAELWGCAFSPDGRQLALATSDRHVAVLDTRHPVSLACTLSGFHEKVHHVAYSPDGALLAAGGDDNIVSLFSAHIIRKWDRIATLRPHSGAITSLCFSPRSDLLLVGTRHEKAFLWRVPPADPLVAAPLVVFGEHRAMIYGTAFSADQSLAITASFGGDIRAWRTTDGAQSSLLRLPALHSAFSHVADVSLFSMSFHAASGWLSAGLSQDGGLLLWRQTPRSRRQTGAASAAASAAMDALDAALADGGARALTAAMLQLWLWDLDAQRCAKALDGVDGAQLCALAVTDLTARGAPFDDACRLLLAAFMSVHRLGQAPHYRPPTGMIAWEARALAHGLSAPTLCSLSVTEVQARLSVGRDEAVDLLEDIARMRADDTARRGRPQWTARWTANRPIDLSDMPAGSI